jgi:hypothetical protein
MLNFASPAAFILQLGMNELFNQNKASLKMYDEMIKMINTYTGSKQFIPGVTELVQRKAFLSRSRISLTHHP